MPAAILFDLDGTLIDTERESAEAMARAIQATFGIGIDQSDRDYITGRSWVAIYERMIAKYPALTWTRDELAEATADFREGVFAERGITIMPGARALLAATRERRRALVTGSSRKEALQALAAIGDDGRFDHIFAAEDVPTSKPDPEGYRRAMRALGAAPHECVVFEDSVSGIAAGRAAGCTVVAVRAGNFSGHDQSAAHLILDTLEPVTLAWLDELVAKSR